MFRLASTRRAGAQHAAGIGRRIRSPFGAEAQTERANLPPVTVTAPEQKRAAGARPPRNAARSAPHGQAGARSGAADRQRSGAGRSRRAGGDERAAGADAKSTTRRAASRSCRPRPTGIRPSPTPSRTSWTMCRASSRSRNGATTPGFRSAARACRAISICAACSSTWTAFRSTPPTATAISRRSTRPPTAMSRSTRAPTRCGSAPTRSAAPSIS